MPIGVIATVRGAVVQEAGAGTFGGYLVNAAQALPTVVGSVGAATVEAFAAVSTATAIRVKLGGDWIPEGDLVGDVSWSSSIDTHRASGRLALRGREHGVFSTLRTWTATPVEIWRAQQGPGDPVEEIVLRGWVVPGTSQGGTFDPEISIGVDNAAFYDGTSTCVEVAPRSGRTRGSIAREIAAGAGITSTSIPDGSRYTKAVFTEARPVFDVLREFGEPEDWRWRLAPDSNAGHVLEAYVPAMKVSPQPPDHTWSYRDWDSIRIAAPANVPSRVISRGVAAVTFDEDGLRTELNRTEIQSVFAPEIAVARQLADGSQGTVGGVSQPPKLRTVRVIEVQDRFRGTDLVDSTTKEFGWHNPRAPRLISAVGGPGPDGYLYAVSYITAKGEYVTWFQQRFVQVGERRLVNQYDGDRNLVGTVVEEDRWRSITQAVGLASGIVSSGVLVGDDDQSYTTPLEQYGRAVRHESDYLYNGDTGAVDREEQRTYSYYSPRASLDIGSNPLRYDGTARVDQIDRFQITESQSVVHVVQPDGLIGGTIAARSGFEVQQRLNGSHDFGGGVRSDKPTETFRVVSVENKQFNRRPDGTIEELIYPGDGPPTARILQGGLPIPRYQLSPWTTLRQEPLEYLLDDEVLAGLFGSRDLVVQSEHIQSLAEAEALARRKLARASALRVTIVRPTARCQPGDTVLLIDPHHSLCHRALLVAADVVTTLATGESTGTYQLEVPLV